MKESKETLIKRGHARPCECANRAAANHGQNATLHGVSLTQHSDDESEVHMQWKEKIN